ncbi:ubiquitin carboxyl-terminal hydrolase MINDY-3 homolog [Anopheles moucheti]|uniref:ubiquitin carboxyl-terminal hydrolase MINDY-3 homolog n=1 Tax=Anopheles moucheti TaxID=186751 RepID=UPI0022F0BCCF|nr:ubiquitin carboxyl-terminal hydrolase MINDY-3 homolog [Anopheles moucheti]XP_052899947.1 ubiquitin carboxyl-terminal hydrolase MINDY-3 homolog [Anopheles moucheti]
MGENLAPACIATTVATTGIEQAEAGSSGATVASGSYEDGDGSAASARKAVSKKFFSLLWGEKIKHDVFRRWLQGFSFSDFEPSALVQRDGGPCCVIAPVQAYLLKILLMESPEHGFNELTADKCKTLLIQAVCQILMKCKTDVYRIVTLEDDSDNGSISTTATNQSVESTVDEAGCSGYSLQQHDSNESHRPGIDTHDAALIHPSVIERAKSIWTSEAFHERIRFREHKHIDDVHKFYVQNFHVLTDECGVLLLLYTVLQTKGLEHILSEMSDPNESLIHDTYGCGSQALINLMLTGRAVPHVWDNEQDVGGMKLKGINQQSDIGFITVMEQLQYCTVGFFYKNPKNPVWVMGSDTHLTVLFSHEKRLVSPETPGEIARRVFRQFDPDESNFIPSAVLQDVLCALELVSEPEYVELMRSRLDPENLGIILLNAFMSEFFPDEKKSTPDTFDLLHYNGIPNSNYGNVVKYSRGQAVLLESDVRMCNPSDPMLTCLQTKWPNIEVNWSGHRTPSLN